MKKYLNEERLANEDYSKYFLEIFFKLQRKPLQKLIFCCKTFLYGCQGQIVILFVSYNCNILIHETAHSNGNCRNNQKQ